jgi:hypothetical protein
MLPTPAAAVSRPILSTEKENSVIETELMLAMVHLLVLPSSTPVV